MLKGLILGVTLSLGVLLVPSVSAEAPTDAPTPPRDLTATATETGGVQLSWDPPLLSGSSAIQGYIIYRDGMILETVSGLSYVDSSGNWDTVYWVTAYNSQEQSAPSNPTTIWMPKGDCVNFDPFPFPNLVPEECFAFLCQPPIDEPGCFVRDFIVEHWPGHGHWEPKNLSSGGDTPPTGEAPSSGEVLR